MSIDPSLGVAGGEADNGPKDVRSFNSTQAIAYGNLACLVAGTDSQCRRPSGAADITDEKIALGIARAAFDVESQNDGKVPNYPVESQVNVAVSGRYYVKVEESVTPASTVFVRHAIKNEIKVVTYSDNFEAGDSIEFTINGVQSTVAFNNNNADTYGDINTALAANYSGILTQGTANPAASTITLEAASEVELTVSFNTVASGATPTVATTQAGQTLLDQGSFRASADNATASALPNAKFVKSASAGEIAVVQLGL